MLNECLDEGGERVNARMCVTAGQQNFPLTEKLFLACFCVVPELMCIQTLKA